MKWRFLFLCFIILSACQPQTVTSTSVTATKTAQPTLTMTLPPTSEPTSPPTKVPPTPTITATVPQICCPLEDETFESLPLILVNPLVIPSFGHDDGHHGLDFSYYQRGERESIQGVEIYAVLSGKTVLTLGDEIPYGYSVMIETPLTQLPDTLQKSLMDLYQPVPEDVTYQGECPEFTPPEMTGELSVYHLYAHIESRPTFKTGDPVSCGETLGTVGNTGLSSNPHLHLETRIGPANSPLGEMAFYQTTYTDEERANYCLWRMSGYFQLFDPFLLFEEGN